MRTRTGYTLLEVIVVIAIIGTLLAIILPAVQKARQAAIRADNMNRVRQITLGLHQYAAAHDGALPGARVPSPMPYGNVSPLFNVLPYLNPPFPYPYSILKTEEGGVQTLNYYPFPYYFSPTDPTIEQSESNTALMTSFVVNWQIFRDAPKLPMSISDGTSQTIGVAEKYYHPQLYSMRTVYLFAYPPDNPSDPNSGVGTGMERSGSFADPGWLDVVPVTSGSPPISRPSVPGTTFQSAPAPAQADGRMLQSSLPSGLVVGMMDGSARVIRPRVAETVFWAYVTPAASDSTSE